MNKRRVAAPAALVLSLASLSTGVAHADATDGITYFVNNASGANCTDTGPGTEVSPSAPSPVPPPSRPRPVTPW